MEQALTATRIGEILSAEGIDVRIEGDADDVATAFCGLSEPAEGCLCFYVVEDNEAVSNLKHCVVLTGDSVTAVPDTVTQIVCDHPKLAFYIVACQSVPAEASQGVHPTALVDDASNIDPSAAIGAHSVVEASTIGPDCVVESHVVIKSRTLLKDKVTVEANTTLGATGQIWAWGLDGKKWVPPQLGGTSIGSGVFIGANVTIVRGALQDTVIGDECRIAHGTRIGHNSRVGAGTFISSQVAIPGSVTIGENCFIGSGAVFRPGVRLCDDVTVGAGSVVQRDCLKPGAVLVGNPARVVKIQSGGAQLPGIPIRNDLKASEGE